MYETDGRRWVDFEVADRSANTFELLYARLLEAQPYCSDRYAVHSACGVRQSAIRREKAAQ